MPLYEYTCGKCRRTSEHLVRSTNETQLPDCPQCGSRRMKKELSVFAATGAEPDPAPPSCSGNPGNCGRCG